MSKHIAVAGPLLLAMCQGLLDTASGLASPATGAEVSAGAGDAGASAGAGAGAATHGPDATGIAGVMPKPTCSKGFVQVLLKMMPTLTAKFA